MYPRIHVTKRSARRSPRRDVGVMSALLNFKSFLVVMLLFICTATYVRQQRPSMFREKKPGFLGLVYKASVIGTRLSPYVSISCILMGLWNLFF